jgi:hypothetical protein
VDVELAAHHSWVRYHRAMKLLAVLAVLVALASVVEARASKAWDYKQLVAAADVVVIATPTKTTTTRTTEQLDAMNVTANRVETQFKVTTALKGTPGDSFTLHHDMVPNDKAMTNGPSLVSFDPTAHKQYLMFLVKAKDGEYTPVSGQTDATWSVEPLALPAAATP